MYAFTTIALALLLATLGCVAALKAVGEHQKVVQCITTPASSANPERVRALCVRCAETSALYAIAAGVLLSVSALVLSSVYSDAANVGKVFTALTLATAFVGMSYERRLERAMAQTH